jgi:hypothetical protein
LKNSFISPNCGTNVNKYTEITYLYWVVYQAFAKPQLHRQ